MKNVNVFSGFDGMSCGQYVLDILGVNTGNYFASEIKNHAMKVTNKHFPSTTQLGDITKIKGESLPKIDLYIGGSPCQDFSQANRERKGVEGEKSGLFWEYVRLLNEVREINPDVLFFLENVKMKKEHEDLITGVMGVEPVKINSKLVSGQLRNRLYWTNINNGEIAQPEDKKINLQDILTEGFTDREKARTLLESDSRPLSTPVKMFHRYYATGFTTLIFKDENHYHDCKTHYNNHFKGCSAKEIDTLIEDGNIDLSTYEGVRYMNKQERCRLQGLPEDYCDVLTENEAACLLGDGWNCQTIQHIFNHLPTNWFKIKGEK